MEINDNHNCVYCGVNHAKEGVEAPTEITCANEAQEHSHKFVPAGDTVLLGQIIDGKATITIHEDLTADEIALLMAAFMDRISRFEHIKEDPSVIMKAIMGGVQSG